MIAATTAAGFPFVDGKPRRKLGSSSCSASANYTSGKLDASLAYTTSVLGTPSVSTPTSSHGRVRNRTASSSTTTITEASSSRTPAPAPAPIPATLALHHGGATPQSRSLVMRLVFCVIDWAWRQWYRFIATWGISVMEPWERIFTLVLFASLIVLFGIALVKLPTYSQYALNRLGYYLFGNQRRIPQLDLSNPSLHPALIPTHAPKIHPDLQLQLCHQLANTSQSTLPTPSTWTSLLLSRWLHNS